MSKFIFVLLIFLVSCSADGILNQSDNVDSIPLLSIKIANDNLAEFRNSRVLSYYTPAKLFYNGNEFLGKIRAAGSGARFHPKWSYKLDLDDSYIFDSRSFNLNSQATDPSFLRTTLTKYIFEQMNFPVFKTAYVNLKVNSEDEGLYLMLERIENEFFRNRNMNVHELIKIVKGAKFTFKDGNTLEFNFEKKIPDDGNYSNLAEMIHALDTTNISKEPDLLNKFLDMHNYIKYHAISSVINNNDSFQNNFFIYKESPKSPYRVIPWDFDNAFNYKEKVGIVGRNNITTVIWSSSDLRLEYLNIIEDLLENIYIESKLFPVIDETAAKIQEAYNIDPYLGYGRFDLNQEVVKLKKHILERREFLINELAIANGNN